MEPISSPEAGRNAAVTNPPSGPPELVGVYRDAEKRVVTWLEFRKPVPHASTQTPRNSLVCAGA